MTLYNSRWNKALRLSEVLKVPKEILPYFNDYKINLFEIAYLSKEQVEMFQSDFKIVADYFVQTRENNEYNPPDTVVRHVHEVLELMEAITKDKRFEEVIRDSESRKGAQGMGEIALDKIEARGEIRGERKVIERALRKGKSPEEVADFNDTPLEKVLEIQSKMLVEVK